MEDQSQWYGKDRTLAILWNEKPTLITNIVGHDESFATRWSWYWGRSWCFGYLASVPSAGKVQVIHDYGDVPDDGKSYQLVERHFYTTFYKIDIRDEPYRLNRFYRGWLAPDGRYVHTRYGNHDGTAYVICVTLYNEIPSDDFAAREHLIQNGWLRITDDATIITANYDELTTRQQQGLKKIWKDKGVKPWDSICIPSNYVLESP